MAEAAAAKALVAATTSGALPELRRLVQDSPSAVNVRGSAGNTPIHVAVALRCRDALQIVRPPALALAPAWQRALAAQMLEGGAADLTLTNSEPDGQSAVELAEELGDTIIARMLKAHGARSTVRARPRTLPRPRSAFAQRRG